MPTPVSTTELYYSPKQASKNVSLNTHDLQININTCQSGQVDSSDIVGDTRSRDYSFPVISRAVRPDNDLNIQTINSRNLLLKIDSLNACGLAAKCLLPDFIEFVNSFDILAVQESNMDYMDAIQAPGYHVCYHNRAK